MKAALTLALLGLVGCATTPKPVERYALSDALPSVLDAHSRAADLQPLKHSAEDELRVWIHGYMAADIKGFVASKGKASKCHATYDLQGGVVSINHARCQPWRKGEGALAALDDLAALDGKAWDCGAEDGFEVLVEGVRHGKRFVLRVGNPTFCSDSDSRAVANLLNKLGDG